MFWVKSAQAIEKKRGVRPSRGRLYVSNERSCGGGICGRERLVATAQREIVVEERYGDAVQRAAANNTTLTGNP